jgi:RND family efflux transporter MFP subunit
MGRLLLGLIVVASAVGISIYWLTHRPTAQHRPPQAQAALVDVRPVRSQTETVVVHAMGTVVPAKSIHLASRVSGQIVEVSPRFVPGGNFQRNDKILQIERDDYALAVEQRRSELIKAERDLKMEMGMQSVAQREYELLDEEVLEEDKELLLRKPQLEIAKAAVASAEAALKKAQLDLKRTTILSPFSAMVQSRNVDLGSQVSAGAVLASLVGTDKYWIEVSVPVDELRWLNIPGYNAQTGSPARVYYESAWGRDTYRAGTIERLMTDVEPQGRMARLLVRVEDPLQLQVEATTRHSLILGSYVRVDIDGIEVPAIIKLPRTALREGDQVWVMQPDGALDIRTVSIVWSGNDHVYISTGLNDGDLLITSNLAAPVRGMALRTDDLTPASEPAQKQNKSPSQSTENSR